MFPAPTSMMPIPVALARFLEQGGNIWANYPYWYLGSTPYRYLTGPIIPALLVVLHGLVPALSLFDALLAMTTVAWLIGGYGWYLTLSALGGRRSLSLMAALFYLFGPIMPYLFRFSDGIHLIAFSLLPFVLIVYIKLLNGWTKKRAAILILTITLILLIDTSFLAALILGMIVILLTVSGWQKIEEKIKQSFKLLAFSFLLSTIWYTPGYWWQLLISPSFAGKPLYSVISQLLQLLPTCVALVLAVVSGKIIKSKSRVLSFAIYWLTIFGFLTLLRFIADPDFWLDWSGYGLELQLGLGILGGLLMSRILNIFKNQNAKIKMQNDNAKFPAKGWSASGRKNLFLLLGSFTLYFFLFSFIFKLYVVDTLQTNIIDTVEYRIGNQLSKIAKPEERIFLSGTTAFWLNAFFNLIQVRGGKDEAAVGSDWRQAVWEVRDGSTSSPQEATERSLGWLRKLNIKYLVVHTANSREYYHDFAYPEKFVADKRFKKVYEGQGDIIYQVLR